MHRFCTWLDELPDARLVPLVHSILTNVTATVSNLPEAGHKPLAPLAKASAEADQRCSSATDAKWQVVCPIGALI